jgi:predicted phage terminase large subunit-like protein
MRGRPKPQKGQPAFELDAGKLEARALRVKMLRPGGFEHFVRHFWEYVDPAPLRWNWHMDALCLMLELLGRGLISKLLINLPPGMGKSILCSVLWQAWKWALDPGWSAIFGSHDEDLALRDAVKARDLIKNDEYRRIFRPEWDLEAWDFNTSQDTKHLYKTTAGGMRYSTSIGGSITGFRGNAVGIDDPLDANKGVSEVELKTARDWLGNLPSRINDLENSQWLMIMQRICEGDPSDVVLAHGDWVHLNLPAEFDPENRCQIVLDGELVWQDPRTELGEPLFPQIQPKHVLDQLRTYLGDPRFEAQYNQRIIAHKGGIIQWDDLRWFDHPPQRIRERCTEIVLVGDLTFMKTEAQQKAVEERRAFNNLDIWGTDGRNFYLLDNAHGRWQYPEFEAVILELARRWGVWTAILEDAAVAAVVSQLLDKMFGQIIEMKALGSKQTRLETAARYTRQHRVYLPNEAWAREAMTEVTRFGISQFKDRADTFSMAILYFTLQGSVELGGGVADGQSDYEQDITMDLHNPAGYLA